LCACARVRRPPPAPPASRRVPGPARLGCSGRSCGGPAPDAAGRTPAKSVGGRSRSGRTRPSQGSGAKSGCEARQARLGLCACARVRRAARVCLPRGAATHPEDVLRAHKAEAAVRGLRCGAGAGRCVRRRAACRHSLLVMCTPRHLQQLDVTVGILRASDRPFEPRPRPPFLHLQVVECLAHVAIGREDDRLDALVVVRHLPHALCRHPQTQLGLTCTLWTTLG
jgi:hypothetical protein